LDPGRRIKAGSAGAIYSGHPTWESPTRGDANMQEEKDKGPAGKEGVRGAVEWMNGQRKQQGRKGGSNWGKVRGMVKR